MRPAIHAECKFCKAPIDILPLEESSEAMEKMLKPILACNYCAEAKEEMSRSHELLSRLAFLQLQTLQCKLQTKASETRPSRIRIAIQRYADAFAKLNRLPRAVIDEAATHSIVERPEKFDTVLWGVRRWLKGTSS